MAQFSIDDISLATFNDILSRYPSTVPDKLHNLDELRYTTIPATAAKRKEDGRSYLTQDEVEKLVEWKLKHGTFRPKLLQLVQSNASSAIQHATEQAFGTAKPLPALKVLTQLKGIGPATASLLLSVHAADAVPFFSDELFRWCMWDEAGKPNGWKRVIKYTAKEYEQVVDRVGRLRERLGVRAVEAEKVAWVLGKEDVDVGGEEDGGKAKEGTAEVKSENAAEKPAPTARKVGRESVKRKVEDQAAPSEDVRRSSRRKTKA